jgi:hypothetical protein
MTQNKHHRQETSIQTDPTRLDADLKAKQTWQTPEILESDFDTTRSGGRISIDHGAARS